MSISMLELLYHGFIISGSGKARTILGVAGDVSTGTAIATPLFPNPAPSDDYEPVANFEDKERGR